MFYSFVTLVFIVQLNRVVLVVVDFEKVQYVSCCLLGDSLGNYKDGTSKDDKEWQVSLEPHDHVFY
jgi:hypothetical protein